jgi:tRNA(His) 5'-end guanylyltransferase
MHGLDTSKLQELLFQEVGINWSRAYTPELKRGTVTYRRTVEVETPNGRALRSRWVVEAAPIFQSEEGKAWLLSLLCPKPEEQIDGQ